MRLFRVAQFAAAPLRRTAVALRPPSANSNQYCQNHPRHSNRQPPVCDANPHFVRWHDATYCSSPELRGPQPLPRGGPQLTFARSRSPQAAARTQTRHSNRQPPVCDTNPRHAARWRDVGMCNARNCAAKRRYLRRLAQSATPAAAEDKFNEQSAKPSTAKKYPTPVRASDTLIIIYRETTRGTTAEYPPPRPNRSRPPHWDPWRASAGSSKDWRPGPPSAIRVQP